MEGFEVMPALDAAERGDVFVTVTGARDVLRREHFERMKDGAVLANAGHFDVEIDARGPARGGVRAARGPAARRAATTSAAGGSTCSPRAGVVNLAAAEGHPAAMMDVSFALQALAAEHLVRAGSLDPGRAPGAARDRREVARLKLAALGVEIDALTDEQRAYLLAGIVMGRSASTDCGERGEDGARGDPRAAIDTFRHYYEQLEAARPGCSGVGIEPLEDVPEFDELPEEDGPLDQAVVIKLNGGLGTSMGMTRPSRCSRSRTG